ncbi:MAG: protein translocase subunit SecD [Bryobacteraceae bacterium]|nr:protein translocase subunit SecD [Bryobacteraceae bacterium]MDW8377526.1 protein translocase subunit SecD [Bryobacterales bacterium]
MQSKLRTKFLIILATILVCLYGIVGLPKSKDELLRNLRNNIKLGLDLRGGSHLVLQVQVQDAFKAEADADIERLKDELNRQNIVFSSIERNDPATLEEADKIEIVIKGVPLDKTGAIRSLVSEKFDAWVLTAINSTDYRLTMKPTKALELRRDTLARSMATIESRINGLGLTESTVQPRGRSDAEAELLIQMPGVDDPARVKQILGTAALLELYEVKDGPFATAEQARLNYGGVLPLNSKILRQSARAGEPEAYFVVARTPVITGRDLRSARAQQGEFGKWETAFTLNQDAARRFERFTETHINKRLAIVLDNNIRSAPVIQNRISDSGRITGANDQQEASDLALILRAGSLPASVTYLEERTVGPSLGADSIRQGIISGIVGLLAVVLVMLVYYRRAGVNATVALVLNALILIGVLAYSGAVLTLPGIAGIILLIGMAVDSNVLIFERIREELKAGKGVLAAIDAGFNKAFVTIIDTHVTTVVSCAFLFIFGTGPVKGFAVTLVIGLIANLFTSIFVSRFLFDWDLAGKKNVTSLSI